MSVTFNDPTRNPLIIDHTFVTVPIERDVERTVMGWVAEHLDDLAQRLAVHDMLPGDLALPDWHRLVYVDEVAANVETFADRMARQSIEAAEAQKAADQ